MRGLRFKFCFKNVEEGGGTEQDMKITYVHVLYNRKEVSPLFGIPAYFPL